MNNYFRTTAIAAMLALGLLGSRGAGASEFFSWMNDPTCLTIFHAVMEGLYTDGVSNEDVDCIVQDRSHFVYTCPLCDPALQAFLSYRTRPNFTGLKGIRNTLGKGLDPAMSERLKSTDRTTRMTAIQELIQKWVTRRLESMRLKPAEQEDWRTKLAARRKKGMDVLEHNKGGDIVGWKACAICDACATAGGVTCERPVVMPFGEVKAVTPPAPPQKKEVPKSNETF